MSIVSTFTERSMSRAGMSREAGGRIPIYTGGNGTGGLNLGSIFGGERANRLYKHYKGWPYVAISAIAKRVAGQSFKLGRTNPSGSNRERNQFIFQHRGNVSIREMESWERKVHCPNWIKAFPTDIDIIDQHELLNTFAQPNPLMVQWVLLSVTVANLELTGKCYWFHARDDDGRYQIWPIPTHWVRPSKDMQTYKILTPGTLGDAPPVPAENMAYFYLPDPSNPLSAVSPTQAQILPITTDESITHAQDQMFKRGIFPGIGLRVGRLPGATATAQGRRPVLSAPQRDQLFNLVFHAFEGVANYKEPLILDGLIEDIIKFTHKPDEMDFMDSGKSTKSRILQSYNVNPVVIGEIEDANRATAVVAEQNICTGVVNPLLTLLGQVVTCSIGPAIDDSGQLLIWFEECHAKDRELRLKEYTAAARVGFVNEGEFRTNVLNLPPGDNPNRAYRPINMEEVQINTSKSLTRSRKPTLTVKAKKSRAAMLVTKEMVLDLFTQQESRHADRMQRTMERFFEHQYRTAADRIRGRNLENTNAADIYEESSWRSTLLQASRPVIAQAIGEGAATELLFVRAGFGRTADHVSKVIDPDELGVNLPPNVVNRISAELEAIFETDYWVDILRTTAADIDSLIERAVRQSMSTNQAERLIRDELMGPRAASRANAMARTEIGSALNAGHQASMEELAADGLVTGKEWLSACSNTTRAHHCALSTTIVPVDALFNLGGEMTPYPMWWGLSAENRVNCMCTILSATIADAQDLSQGFLELPGEDIGDQVFSNLLIP